MPGTGDASVVASSLSRLLKKAKRPALLTADQVEFWKDPEKAGWLHSQGEHIRTWRKRWFVLKQGFFFRFSDPNVTPQSRARGVVDLSTVTDVSDGNSVTGRPFSIKLGTATGRICYLADSETAQVEWLSALDGAVSAIVRRIGGWEEDEEDRRPNRSSAGTSSKRDPSKVLEETLQRSFQAASTSTGHEESGGSTASGMINVVNYSSGTESGRWGGASSQPQVQQQYVDIDYGAGIAGANVLDTSAPTPSQYGAGGGYTAGGIRYDEPTPQPAFGGPQGYGGYSQDQAYAPYAGVAAQSHGNLLDTVTAPQVWSSSLGLVYVAISRRICSFDSSQSGTCNELV